MEYIVKDSRGKEIFFGDMIFSSRGSATFESVSRGPEYNGTAKIIVMEMGSRREYYARVFDLIVSKIEQ